MAYTIAVLNRTNDMIELTIIKALDADTVTGAITHNMGANALVTLIPVTAKFYLSNYFVAAGDQNVNTIQLTGAAGLGSGDPAIQARLRVERVR